MIEIYFGYLGSTKGKDNGRHRSLGESWTSHTLYLIRPRVVVVKMYLAAVNSPAGEVGIKMHIVEIWSLWLQ